MNVTLDDITSTNLDDADVLLVGPQGQRAMILSDAGGDDDVGPRPHVRRPAAGKIPNDPDGDPRAATSRPTTLSSTPSPARRLLNATGDLSVFDGTDPNGTSALYAVDDTSGDVTAIQRLVARHRVNDPTRPPRAAR